MEKKAKLQGKIWHVSIVGGLVVIELNGFRI